MSMREYWKDHPWEYREEIRSMRERADSAFFNQPLEWGESPRHSEFAQAMYRARKRAERGW